MLDSPWVASSATSRSRVVSHAAAGVSAAPRRRGAGTFVVLRLAVGAVQGYQFAGRPTSPGVRLGGFDARLGREQSRPEIGEPGGAGVMGLQRLGQHERRGEPAASGQRGAARANLSASGWSPRSPARRAATSRVAAPLSSCQAAARSTSQSASATASARRRQMARLRRGRGRSRWRTTSPYSGCALRADPHPAELAYGHQVFSGVDSHNVGWGGHQPAPGFVASRSESGEREVPAPANRVASRGGEEQHLYSSLSLHPTRFDHSD